MQEQQKAGQTSAAPTPLISEERLAELARIGQAVDTRLDALNEKGLNTEPMKPGWQTSEGQLVGALLAFLSIAVVVGWVSPTQAQNWRLLIATEAHNVGPLLLLLPVVWHYITSRGKLKSNTVKASATVLAETAAAGIGPLAAVKVKDLAVAHDARLDTLESLVDTLSQEISALKK